MNNDIRIAVSFKGHRKRKRLGMILGPGSTDYLIDLWIGTAQNHPSGVLVGMDETDIALEAGWTQDPQAFIDGLQKCGFLDKNDDGVFTLHDWDDHQGYVVHAESRRERARSAAITRWKSKDKTDAVQPECGEHTDGMPDAMPLPAPAPAPAPAPESKATAPPAAPVSSAKVKKKSKADGYVFPGIPDWIGEREWNEYVEMRKRRSPLTDWGKHLTVLDLEKLRSAGNDPNAVLNQSTQKSWRGVFKIDGGNHGAHSGGNQGSGHPKAEPGKYAQLRPGEKVSTSDEL